jgi:hypothetical protein
LIPLAFYVDLPARCYPGATRRSAARGTGARFLGVPFAGADSRDVASDPPDPSALPSPSARRPPRGRPFEPGNRMNPGGRPRTDARFRELAKRGSLRALRYALAVLADERASTSARLKAAELVIERAHGRPPTAITGAEGAPLIPGAAAPGGPLAALLARIAARQSAPAALDATGPTPAEIASPAANGDEPRGVA